jgi:hypothetical protein
VTAALLTACSSDPVGPLGNGGAPSLQCMSHRQGQPVTTGLFELDNTGSSPVTVQSVTLPSARGLRMTKSWLVPTFRDPKNGDFLDLGAGFPYPPAYSAYPPEYAAQVRRVWAERRPAAGAVIEPGEDLNLVFGLTRTTAKAGRSDGPLIVYSAGGSTYSLQELTDLIVAQDCSTLPQKDLAP